MDIQADMETSALEIKTDSLIGSEEKVSTRFYTDRGYMAGGFVLYFTSPPQYKIRSCTQETDFSTKLPTDTNKVWRIKLTRTTDITLVIHCNEVKVLNILFVSTCTDNGWDNVWYSDVSQIRFDDEDTASDDHRLRGRGSYDL